MADYISITKGLLLAIGDESETGERVPFTFKLHSSILGFDYPY